MVPAQVPALALHLQLTTLVGLLGILVWLGLAVVLPWLVASFAAIGRDVRAQNLARLQAGAVAAGNAAASNPYVNRLIEDEEQRDNQRTAYESARTAYGRMANGRGPAKALLDDKKTQKELQQAATNLKEAADALRGGSRKRKGKKRTGLLLLIVGAGAAIALSEGLR